LTLVAVIADTHLPRGARAIPPACLERLERADVILHAGDVSSLAALEEIRSHGIVHAVYGNADEPALRETLPKELVVDAGGAKIGLVHIPGPAAAREARLVARFPGCHGIVYGHTHRPQVELHAGVWILNPGSPTERRTAPAHTMLMLMVNRGEIVPELVRL
jgi:putative phosphoesterase